MFSKLSRITLRDDNLGCEVAGYSLTDRDSGLVLGYVLSKPKQKGEGQRWGFALVLEELKSGIIYPYSSRSWAIKMLLKDRDLVKETETVWSR